MAGAAREGEVRLGAMFRCSLEPELLRSYARRVEELGYDELWIVEDCFYAGGIASAATALAATERITVGLGILPAVPRNPAATAMELATLARLFPGRAVPGLGHGVAAWMHQVGALPPSRLAARGETISAIRAQLAGQTVTAHGATVHLDEVRLDHPPRSAPPVLAGGRGPRSLRLSGRLADGTILIELSSPGYVRWAREQIDTGRAEAGAHRPAPGGRLRPSRVRRGRPRRGPRGPGRLAAPRRPPPRSAPPGPTPPRRWPRRSVTRTWTPARSVLRSRRAGYRASSVAAASDRRSVRSSVSRPRSGRARLATRRAQAAISESGSHSGSPPRSKPTAARTTPASR
jgi:hypothetical protein